MIKRVPYLVFFFLILSNSICSQVLESKNGYGLYPKGTYRSLNVFINIIYDQTPSRNPRQAVSGTAWDYDTTESINDPNSYPTYIHDYVDTEFAGASQMKKIFTKYYYEASLGNLILLGDIVVVNIKQSTIERLLDISAEANFSDVNLIKATILFINESNSNGLKTIYGYESLSDYDSDGDGDIDLVNFYYRNSVTGEDDDGTYFYGEHNGGGNVHSSIRTNLKIQGVLCPIDSRCVTDQGQIKEDLSTPDGYRNTPISHEIAHLLLGGNGSHTNAFQIYRRHANTFLAPQSGHGLFGYICVNGFERWRLNWKSSFYNPNNYAIAASNKEADVTKSEGNQTFILRDFISTGDAIRIRLPYSDPNVPAQYIWIENHDINNTGNVDYPHGGEKHACRDASAGIYMYYQVGWDVLSGTRNQVYPPHSNFLRPITAEGNYDWKLGSENVPTGCINGYNNPYHQQIQENPFCGAGDTEDHFFNSDAQFQVSDTRRYYAKKTLDGDIHQNLSALGDVYDAFRGTIAINMGTNPAPVNSITCHNIMEADKILTNSNVAVDNKTIYLSGLSINMDYISGGKYSVTIKWDDYDVGEDTRWTGNIVLNEEINLKDDKKITLTQNKTPIQFSKVNGYYSPKTALTCKPGSKLKLGQYSILTLEENSELIIEDGATLENNGDIVLESGTKVTMKKGSTLCSSNSSWFVIRPGAQFTMDGFSLKNQDIIKESSINLCGTTGSTAQRHLSSNSISNCSNYTVSSGANIVVAAPSIRFTAGFKCSRGSKFYARSLNFCNSNSSNSASTKSAKAPNSEMSYGIEKGNIKTLDDITIYPNPSTGLIHIKTENDEPKQLQIYSTTGALVYSLETSEINVDIDLTGHARGMYIARIISGNNITNKRFIIE